MLDRERIRVLGIITRLNIGGPASHAMLLTEQLDPRRYESRLVSGAEDATEGNYLDLHAHTMSALRYVPELGREIRGAQDVAAYRQLVRLIRDFRPHIVHTHTAKAGTLGRLAAWRCGVPVIVHTYHGHVLEGYFSAAKTRLFVGIERWLATRTSCLVTVSDRVRQDILARDIGRPDRFEVVPLGLELDGLAVAEQRRGELRAELRAEPRGELRAEPQLGVEAGSGVGSGADAGGGGEGDGGRRGRASAPLIGIVARLVPIKAHELFFAAAARIAERYPEAMFVIVGDGERRTELEALAARLGLARQTRFLGWRADLERLYADLDVVVLTSRNEGSPVALIEAMAAARPVVSTRVGGVGDLVTHEETGLLAPPDDAEGVGRQVLRLLDDPALAARLGQAARARVLPAFSSHRLLRDMDALYQRLLAATPATSALVSAPEPASC